MQNFCTNCGGKLNPDNKYCPKCGILIKNEEAKNNLDDINYYLKSEAIDNNINNLNSSVLIQSDSLNYENIQTNGDSNKTNTYVIVGFILSLCSVLTCGFSSVLGLIFSIIGVVNCKKNENKGKGFAIAGIIISSIVLIVVVLMCIFIYIGTNALSTSNGNNFYGPMY